MRSLCLMLLLAVPAAAAEPSTSGEAAPEASLSNRPLRAFWLQPAATPWLLLAGRGYIPIGVNLPVTPLTSLALELTFSFNTGTSRFDPSYAQVWASAGPLVKLTGGSGLTGFFFQPKVLLLYSHEDPVTLTRGSGPIAAPSDGNAYEFQAAADLGYQVAWGRFFFATVIGAGAGYGFGVPEGSPSVMTLAYSGFNRSRVNQPVYSVNLNLLRIGTTF